MIHRLIYQNQAPSETASERSDSAPVDLAEAKKTAKLTHDFILKNHPKFFTDLMFKKLKIALEALDEQISELEKSRSLEHKQDEKVALQSAYQNLMSLFEAVSKKQE